jgi:hypothetical protein
MKKQLHFKSIILLILFVFILGNTYSQNYETSKTLSKSKVVPANVTVNISNHSGDIKINTTNNNTASIQTEIKVSAASETEANKIIKAIENYEFALNGDVLEIDTRFYRNMQSTNNRTTLTLKNGDRVRIKDFTIKHELNIPKNAELKLINKYSNVYLETMQGKTNLNLYSSKLTANDFEQEVTIESKYSKLYIGNFKNETTLNLYDTDIQFKSGDNLEIKSKYSKVEGEKAGELNIDSYDDNFYINEFVDLKMVAKYSDLVSEAILNNMVLDLYDSNIKISSAKIGGFTGKYSDLKLGNIKALNITESYDNNIYMGKTGNVNIAQSKYSKYEIGSTSKFDLVGYDDDVEIDELNTDFAGISVDGKYSKLEVNAGSVPFKVDVKMKYGKIDIPESVNLSKHIEKNSELEMLSNESGATIMVRGYDMKVVIK